MGARDETVGAVGFSVDVTSRRYGLGAINWWRRLKLLLAMLIGSALSGCLIMEGTAPQLRRSDLGVYPDYSGTYVSYGLDDKGNVEVGLPTSVIYFDRLSEGEYRFAALNAPTARPPGDGAAGSDAPAKSDPGASAAANLPVFGGYLYLLDVGVENEAVGILYGQKRDTGAEQVVFLRIRRVTELRFDVAMFTQNDNEKYALLTEVARRHGMEMSSASQGHLLGRPSGEQLRAAYLADDFLANVNSDAEYTMLRLDTTPSWPKEVRIDQVASLPLKIIEDRPEWRATGKGGTDCSLSYEAAEGAKLPQLVVHGIDGELALELNWPESDMAGDSARVSWRVDNSFQRTLQAKREVLSDGALVIYPLPKSLLADLANGAMLRLSARGLQPMALPLQGSASATAAFLNCLRR